MADKPLTDDPVHFDFAIGASILASLVTGAASLFVAFVAVVNESDFTGAGLALLAAAAAFGLLANALLRS